MKKREIDTAARFGLLDRLQALENDLTAIPGTARDRRADRAAHDQLGRTAIPGTTYIDFDLSGLYDRCPLCFVVGYDIDVRREDYFEARREWIKAVIMVFLAHDLPPTGDTIEDYGASYYFVRRMGKTWEEMTPA